MHAGFSLILAVALLFPLSACVKKHSEQGYAQDFSTVGSQGEKITTKEDVRKRLGSPSSTSDFGEERWFYIRSKLEQVAFFAPETVMQDVLAITFDNEGNIKGVERYGLQDGRRIDYAKDYTPTEGNELGFFEQLLGNLGRFNPGQGQQ